MSFTRWELYHRVIILLLEARAVRPLLLMGESDTGARESALDAILTLVIDGENLQKGSKILDEAGVCT